MALNLQNEIQKWEKISKKEARNKAKTNKHVDYTRGELPNKLANQQLKGKKSKKIIEKMYFPNHNGW